MFFVDVVFYVLICYCEWVFNEFFSYFCVQILFVCFMFLVVFCVVCVVELIDVLVMYLMDMVYYINVKVEWWVECNFVVEFWWVYNKDCILEWLLEVVLGSFDGIVCEVLFLVVDEQILCDLLCEYKEKGGFWQQVYIIVCGIYCSYYWWMIFWLFIELLFWFNNYWYQLVIDVLSLLGWYVDSNVRIYLFEEYILVGGVIDWNICDLIFEWGLDGGMCVNCVNYELCVLFVLWDVLCFCEIWVVGVDKYCDFDKDLFQDFEVCKESYFQVLRQLQEVDIFVQGLEQQFKDVLVMLYDGLLKNFGVWVVVWDGGCFVVMFLIWQLDLFFYDILKGEVGWQFWNIQLFDVLVEVD